MEEKKYKLINKTTNEEHICSKVVIDGYNYYVSNTEQPLWYGELYHCSNKGKGNTIHMYALKSNLCIHCKKVIATNNPKIDLPNIPDELSKVLVNLCDIKADKNNTIDLNAYGVGIIEGYNKSQETYPFSEEDMIEFNEWMKKEDTPENAETYFHYSDKDMLNAFKEQRIKTIYYE